MTSREKAPAAARRTRIGLRSVVIGCVGAVAISIGLVVLGGGWVGWSVANATREAVRFGEIEQRRWPLNTARSALRTRSTTGRFTTRAVLSGGDEDLSGTDYVELQARACEGAMITVASQPHSACVRTPLACDVGSAERRDERYGLRLRWLDDARLELRWTEFAGLDADGHRTWTGASETVRIELRESPEEYPCDAIDGPCDRCADGRALFMNAD